MKKRVGVSDTEIEHSLPCLFSGFCFSRGAVGRYQRYLMLYLKMAKATSDKLLWLIFNFFIS